MVYGKSHKNRRIADLAVSLWLRKPPRLLKNPTPAPFEWVPQWLRGWWTCIQCPEHKNPGNCKYFNCQGHQLFLVNDSTTSGQNKWVQTRRYVFWSPFCMGDLSSPLQRACWVDFGQAQNPQNPQNLSQMFIPPKMSARFFPWVFFWNVPRKCRALHFSGNTSCNRPKILNWNCGPSEQTLLGVVRGRSSAGSLLDGRCTRNFEGGGLCFLKPEHMSIYI